ncbi:MAG: hypothetical protein ABI560_09680, partial [Myxococcales bacterium]
PRRVGARWGAAAALAPGGSPAEARVPEALARVAWGQAERAAAVSVPVAYRRRVGKAPAVSQVAARRASEAERQTSRAVGRGAEAVAA